MDPNTPRQELVKQFTTSSSGASGASGTVFAQFTENPFFAAVRWTSMSIPWVSGVLTIV